jgi:hypothetical protein
MNRKSFWIGTGWVDLQRVNEVFGGLSLHSNTWVLEAGREMVKAPFEVERVHGSWSPHIPEKRPKYRVSWGSGRPTRGEVITLEPVRLQVVAMGRDILVPLTANRPQTCLKYKGQLHGVYHNVHGRNPFTYCGENPYLAAGVHTRDLFTFGEPTCKACLTYKSVWCLYTVFNYEHKDAVLKRERKEKTIEEKRLRLPTAYARILDDGLFENPSYKPVKQRVDHTEEIDATDDYVDPREEKRMSLIDRTRRIEESKARIQGHRR